MMLAMYVCVLSLVNSTKWHQFVKTQTPSWRTAVNQWLSVTEDPVLIVGYENLMNNTYVEVKRMLDFIGNPYSEDDILCAVKSSGESFHRKHAEKQFNPFTPELQEFVLNQAKQIDARLLEHNISIYHPYTI